MRASFILASALAVLVMSGRGYGQTSTRPPSLYEGARSALSDAVVQGKVGSAVGLVARGDRILLLNAVGDIEPGEPMPVNAIARIASIQKPITAAAVLILYERGQLDLRDPVSRWIPDFGRRVLTARGDTVPAARSPTVLDLLTHEAGLVPEGPELDALWDVATTQEFARRIGSIPLRFQPGSRFDYGCCGSAYEVLAAIVEQVSGQSFKDFLTANVLRPLGMWDTYFFVPEAKLHRLAAQYGRGPDGALTVARHRGQEEPENSFYSGGGGLRSTVLDFYRFAVMLQRGGELDGVRLLKPETVRMMVSDQVGPMYPEVGYGWGFGVRVKTTGSGRGSYGWNGGTGTRFEVDPESGLIAIVFVPTRPGTPGVSQVRNEFVSRAIAAGR